MPFRQVHGCCSVESMESRFLDMNENGVKRRAARERKRRERQNAQKKKSQQKKKKSQRAGKRSKRMPCCGKERRYCKCSNEIRYMFNDSAMNGFITSILRCGIMNLEDAKDMAFIIPKLNNARMSIHNFMFRASLLRMYSRPSPYKALCQHVGAPQPGSRPPDFKSMKKALVKLYAVRESQNKQRRHPRPLPSGEVGADSVGTQALPLKNV